jgi:hypothetical protein
MCRFTLITLCHVSLSGEVVVDVDQKVSATCHVWGPLVRCPALGWDPLADMDQWEGATWHMLGASLGLQVVPKVCSVPKLYPERPRSNLSPLICLLNLFYFL